jgi:hypothetical protein
MKVGDLVEYIEPTKIGSLEHDNPMTNGIVVGFDKDQDPIVYFFCREKADPYYADDIEVLNASR